MPIEQRERFREALALVLKAWSAREVFAWNGKHYQLGMVNLWPRPIQQPHPPVWIPGSGISSTAEYVVEHDHCFCHLSYFGAKNAKAVTDRYWDYAVSKGRDDNPYRFSFLQLIGVAETDAEAEDLYAEHAEYFFHKLLYTPQHYLAIPGCLEYGALVQTLKSNPRAAVNPLELKAKDFYERGLRHRRLAQNRARAVARRHQAIAHGASAGAVAFRLDADRVVQAQHRSVRARGAALSGRSMGRQVRGPLVAGAVEEEARRRPRHGRRILTRGSEAWRARKHAG